MKRIILFGSPKKPDAARVIAELLPWFAERAEVALCDPTGLAALPAEGGPIDLILSFGGDGTLLGLARKLAGRPIPVLGVNFGKLGYMAEFSVAEMQEHFGPVLAGRLPITPRRMLQVHVQTDGRCRFESPALNEIVVSAGPPFKMISVSIEINGRHVTAVSGDGLIVSTPSGSTAYNLAAGGPVVIPGVPALAITPICPHTLTHRPIVVADDSRIEIRNERPSDVSQLVVDGQVSCPLNFADRVQVTRAGYDFLLVENPGRSAFDTLRNKLHWGVAPA